MYRRSIAPLPPGLPHARARAVQMSGKAEGLAAVSVHPDAECSCVISCAMIEHIVFGVLDLLPIEEARHDCSHTEQTWLVCWARRAASRKRVAVVCYKVVSVLLLFMLVNVPQIFTRAGQKIADTAAAARDAVTGTAEDAKNKVQGSVRITPLDTRFVSFGSISHERASALCSQG